jgi:hypothetical protein
MSGTMTGPIKRVAGQCLDDGKLISKPQVWKTSKLKV